MRITLFFLCFAVGCWRGPSPRLEQPRNEGDVRITSAPKPPSIELNRQALVNVVVQTSDAAGQAATYNTYGVVVDRHHILTGSVTFAPGETIVALEVSAHDGVRQPKFSMPATVIGTQTHPNDPKLILLTLLATQKRLPVAPVTLSGRLPSDGQMVEMLMPESVATPWAPDHGTLSLWLVSGHLGFRVNPTQWSTNAVFDDRYELVGYETSLVPEILLLLEASHVRYRLSQ